MSPPTANTRVFEVRTAGGTPDWDSPDPQGEAKFEGAIAAVYTERRERIRGATGDTFGLRRSLTFFPRSLGGLEFEQRDEITYVWKNKKRTGVVISVEEFDMPGRNMPGSVRVAIDPKD